MKHLHILKRVGLKKSKDLFMCADPECNWTRRKEFLVGKKFKCPLCGNPYLVSADMLRRKLPHCQDCTADVVPAKKVDLIIKDLVQIQPFGEIVNASSLTTKT